MSDISKPCADFLRDHCLNITSSKLKASHAHEMVAAFFGYKTKISLLSDKSHPLSNLEEAAILIPNLTLMNERRHQLKDFPESLPPANVLAKAISDFLQTERHFVGDVWLVDSLETYIIEVLLPDYEENILDHLAGAMAGTNAAYDEAPNYETSSVAITFKDGSLEITASGTLDGEPLEDKMFSGNAIAFNVHITLPRIAGKRAFGDVDIEVSGLVKDDWRDSPSRDSANFAVPITHAYATNAVNIGNALASFENFPGSYNRTVENILGKTMSTLLEDQERFNKLQIGSALSSLLDQDSAFKEQVLTAMGKNTLFDDALLMGKLPVELNTFSSIEKLYDGVDITTLIGKPSTELNDLFPMKKLTNEFDIDSFMGKPPFELDDFLSANKLTNKLDIDSLIGKPPAGLDKSLFMNKPPAGLDDYLFTNTLTTEFDRLSSIAKSSFWIDNFSATDKLTAAFNQMPTTKLQREFENTSLSKLQREYEKTSLANMLDREQEERSKILAMSKIFNYGDNTKK